MHSFSASIMRSSQICTPVDNILKWHILGILYVAFQSMLSSDGQSEMVADWHGEVETEWMFLQLPSRMAELLRVLPRIGW